MSYIEKKYLEKISEIFDQLTILDTEILELIKERSIKHEDKFASLCASVNKQVNIILKNYYPDIKELDDKLNIKSKLKFYYDLIDKLTDLVRHVNNFDKIDDQYFDFFIKFLLEKDILISGKYRAISSQELTAFYDQGTRNDLEAILIEKIDKKKQQFFAMGPLEQEIKKIGIIAGAENVEIKLLDEDLREKAFTSAQTFIEITVNPENDEKKTLKVLKELRIFLESKKYIVSLHENKLITNAKLLFDDN